MVPASPLSPLRFRRSKTVAFDGLANRVAVVVSKTVPALGEVPVRCTTLRSPLSLMKVVRS